MVRDPRGQGLLVQRRLHMPQLLQEIAAAPRVQGARGRRDPRPVPDLHLGHLALALVGQPHEGLALVPRRLVHPHQPKP